MWGAILKNENKLLLYKNEKVCEKSNIIYIVYITFIHYSTVFTRWKQINVSLKALRSVEYSILSLLYCIHLRFRTSNGVYDEDSVLCFLHSYIIHNSYTVHNFLHKMPNVSLP